MYYTVSSDYKYNLTHKRDRILVWSGAFCDNFEGVGYSLPKGNGYMLTLDFSDKIRVACPTPRTAKNYETIDDAVNAAINAARGAIATREQKEPPLSTWARRFDIPVADAKLLQAQMRTRHARGTKACNGDPHPRVADKANKSANAAAWDADVTATIRRIDAVCARINLVFDPGTGLWGSVLRDGRYIDDVPSAD